jgi:hypothetical protein
LFWTWGYLAKRVVNASSRLHWILAMIDRSRKSVGIEGPLGLSIYHAFGQWVDRGMAVDGDVRVDLPAGIYLVNV